MGRPQEAAQLLGAGDAARASVGSGVWPTDLASNNRTTEGIRSLLSAEAFAAAHEEGARLPTVDVAKVAART